MLEMFKYCNMSRVMVHVLYDTRPINKYVFYNSHVVRPYMSVIGLLVSTNLSFLYLLNKIIIVIRKRAVRVFLWKWEDIDNQVKYGTVFRYSCYYEKYVEQYRTRLVRVGYDLNLALGCHRFYYLAPFAMCDPLSHTFLPCQCTRQSTTSTLYLFYLQMWEAKPSWIFLKVQDSKICDTQGQDLNRIRLGQASSDTI
jgi:hypothetical protein